MSNIGDTIIVKHIMHSVAKHEFLRDTMLRDRLYNDDSLTTVNVINNTLSHVITQQNQATINCLCDLLVTKVRFGIINIHMVKVITSVFLAMIECSNELTKNNPEYLIADGREIPKHPIIGFGNNSNIADIIKLINRIQQLIFENNKSVFDIEGMDNIIEITMIVINEMYINKHKINNTMNVVDDAITNDVAFSQHTDLNIMSSTCSRCKETRTGSGLRIVDGSDRELNDGPEMS